MLPSIKPKSAKSGPRPASSSRAISDPRFSNIQTDPRYRLPSRKNTHVKLDNRFAHMLRDDDFSNKASVDRYGRKIPKGEGKKELRKLYDVDEDEIEKDAEIDDDDDVREELARVEQKYDPARQGGFSDSSSDGEDGSELSEGEDGDGVEDAEGADFEGLEEEEEKEEIPMGDVSSRIAIVNMDWENIRAVDLMAVATSFAPPGGRILKVSVYPSEFGRERMEREDLEGPPPELFVAVRLDRRGGISDNDDDDVESSEDFDSQIDSDEQIKSNLLAKSTADTTEVEPHALRAYQLSRLRYFYGVITCDSTNTASTLYNAMDGREYLSSANFFDMRFIPDSVTFDDPVTDKPRDECDKTPDGYRPKEFVTEALTHSKVRLTWDEDDPDRKEVQKRAFSRQEVDENDLKAYVGSDSDEDDIENEGETIENSTISVPKDKVISARDKLRAALGLTVDSSSKATSSKRNKSRINPTAAPVGDMQITFTSGLSSGSARSSIFENRPEDVKEETTREKYIRKEKERKARRKAKAKTTREGAPSSEDEADGGSDSDNDNETNHAQLKPAKSTTMKSIKHSSVAPAKTANGEEVEEDNDPFNDPFFTNPSLANATAKKASKSAKKAALAAATAASAAAKEREKAELELLMAGDDAVVGNGIGTGARGRGFDMAEIRKAEKEEQRRKGKKGRKQKEEDDAKQGNTARGKGEGGGKDDFDLDVSDPRFSGVFSSHEFAIDPSNPRFSDTKGMRKVLEEGRKRRRNKGEEDHAAVRDAGAVQELRGEVHGRDAIGKTVGGAKEKRKADGTEGMSEGLDVLVEKVKRRKVVGV